MSREQSASTWRTYTSASPSTPYVARQFTDDVDLRLSGRPCASIQFHTDCILVLVPENPEDPSSPNEPLIGEAGSEISVSAIKLIFSGSVLGSATGDGLFFSIFWR